MKVHIYLREILIEVGMNLRFAASIPYKLWFSHGWIVSHTNSQGWWQWMEELGQGLYFWALRKVLGLSAHNAIVSFSSRFVVVLRNDLTTCCERHACLFSWGCVGEKECTIYFWKERKLFVPFAPFFPKGKNLVTKLNFSPIQIHKDRLRRGCSFLPPQSFSYNTISVFMNPQCVFQKKL
jgi:hypothetical protein